MDIDKRIQAFTELGLFLKNIANNSNKSELGYNFIKKMEEASISNQWFTASNINFALNEISKSLEKENLEKWISKYPKVKLNVNPKIVGIVAAGNIPLVGFHDIVSVLISGHRVIVKLSSKDDKLLRGIAELLIEIEEDFKGYIEFTSYKLGEIEAIIATGSDNSAKYFEYYFGKYPHIIRKNRNSVAVISGNETEEELNLLADDIFIYFGLGCRNVSKLFIPEDFDINKLFKAIYRYNEIINHNKYANNYMYNKSVLLMNKVKFLENGFSLMVEDSRMASAISVIYYEKYKDISFVNSRLLFENSKIQCIVSNNNKISNAIPFGESQKPKLWDYADNIDTIEFLLSL
ncbi:MAG: hypothetical protein JXR51_15685 [Bacteroidales bacterium]|nr:hypothetical protein [Bacteroidales bacterium]MBN2758611.1 hypothetical protein [Bacteroidales bacterium]